MKPASSTSVRPAGLRGFLFFSFIFPGFSFFGLSALYLPLVFWSLIPILLPAQSQEVTIEGLLAVPFPADLTAAPTGDRLAWVFNDRGARNIWIAEGPDFAGRQLTHYEGDDGQEISGVAFTPDGRHILFVRGGAPNSRGYTPNPALLKDGAQREIWLVAFEGGEPRLLAEGAGPALSPDGHRFVYSKGGQVWSVDIEGSGAPRRLFSLRGNAGSLTWSPDGRRLAFVNPRGDHAFIGTFDTLRQEIRYLVPSVDHDSNPVWSPDGRYLAWIRTPNERNEIIFFAQREALPWSVVVADVESGEHRTVWKATTGPGSAFRYISAARQLFWGADNALVFPYEGDGWTHLWAVPAGGGEARCLTPGNFEVQYVHLSADGKELLYSSNQEDIDRQHVWRIAIAGGAPRQLTSGNGIEWAPVVTVPGNTVVMLASTGRTPAQPVRLDERQQRQPLAPGALPDNWPATALVEPQSVIFPAADGLEIHGQLFLPQDIRPGERRPALLFFHGGSRRQMLLGFHHRGYYHGAYAMNQYLASRGFIVLSVNYRSGIGYGLNFREALHYGAGGASEFNDVLGAGLYLRSRPDVDGARIGLWGGSYGGYLTAMGLARASDLFAAGVDLHGVHDWNVVIKNFMSDYDPAARPAIAKSAFESSPLHFIDGWRSPVLLIHGDDDRNVPFSETVDIGESLRRQGVEFEQLIFPDEVHGFLLHRNWIAAFKATADFFERKLK